MQTNRLGHPDEFLTITCSLNWPEITRPLLHGQKAQDLADNAAQVFCLKLRAMVALIIDEKCFGEATAYLKVIEFQKKTSIRPLYLFLYSSIQNFPFATHLH